MRTRNEGTAWRPGTFAVLASLLGLGLWIQRQPLLDILDIAGRDQEQTYILLVPFVAAWLLWLRRSRFRYVRFRPSFTGPTAVILGSLMSWWGFESGTQIAWHAGAGLAVVGVVLSMTGLEPLRQFAPVFGVLALALPVPGVLRQAIALPLQTMATVVTHSVLELCGVAAMRFGNMLVINEQEIAVGEACNGLRMVFAFGLVVYAFAFSVPLKFPTRVILIALSPIMALVCNVIRLVPTSVFYGYGTASGAEWFHALTGWLMLPVALVILVRLLRLLTWLELPVAQFRLANQ